MDRFSSSQQNLKIQHIRDSHLTPEPPRMSYTEWICPRPFQNDSNFLGNTFRSKIRQDGLESIICDLALTIWIGLTSDGIIPLNFSSKVTFDSIEPEMGKCNVLYRLRMPDRKLWMARLHNPLVQNSTATDAQARREIERIQFESEVATMRYVKKHTRIPVPEVYSFDATNENILGVPYMFMEYIQGKPYPYPFNQRGIIRDLDLLKIHLQLVNYTWQLSRLPFDSISQLQFDPENRENIMVGPIVDRKGRVYGPFKDSKDFYLKRAQSVYEDEVRLANASEDTNAKDTGWKDRIETAHLHCEAAAHLGRAISRNGPFVLKHVDLHWQNILLDEQCTVVGIIDWDWAHTVPIESFHPLPFNFATKMVPLQPRNVAGFEQIALRFLKALEESITPVVDESITFAVLSTQSHRKDIAACLDDYNWPEVRRGHFERLYTLIQESPNH